MCAVEALESFGVRLRIAKDYATRTAFRTAFRPNSDGFERVGSVECGWHLPLGSISPSWVCYAAGVGEDASFDVGMAEHGCEVVSVDPTPRAIAYIEPIVATHANLRLARYALWTESTELEFFPPADPAHVSFSVTNLQSTESPIVVPGRTLPEIMSEFGHDEVHVLKLDIEGAEYPVLDRLDLDTLGVRVLCVEYHFKEVGLSGMIRAVRRMQRRGFRVGHINRTDVTYTRV